MITCDSRTSKYLPQKERLLDHQIIRLSTSDSKRQHSLGRNDIYGVDFPTENAMLILHPTVESRLSDGLYFNIQTSRIEVSYSRFQHFKALVILYPFMTEEKVRVPCITV